MSNKDDLTSAIRELLQDIMNVHSNPDSGEYNYCDDDPCQWCINATSVLADLTLAAARAAGIKEVEVLDEI